MENHKPEDKPEDKPKEIYTKQEEDRIIKEEKTKELQNQLILMITRQTEYTYDEAKDKLLLHNNDYMKVIKEFMNIDTSKKEEKKTTNQVIYAEIRHLMDDAATNYRKQQDYKKQKESYFNAMKTRKEYILADANEKAKQARDKKAQYEESK
jgi:hypothetical protein